MTPSSLSNDLAFRVREEGMALRHTFSGRWRGIALWRSFYWRHIRRHIYECCHSCGRRVAEACPSWWWCDDDALWREVVSPTGGGIRCIPCFTNECRDHGVSLSWGPRVEARLVDGRWVPTRECRP